VKKRYKVTVDFESLSYDIYAENEEAAEVIALDKANAFVKSSGVDYWIGCIREDKDEKTKTKTKKSKK